MLHLNKSDLVNTYLRWAQKVPGYARIKRSAVAKVSHDVLSGGYFRCLNNESYRNEFIRRTFPLP